MPKKERKKERKKEYLRKKERKMKVREKEIGEIENGIEIDKLQIPKTTYHKDKIESMKTVRC